MAEHPENMEGVEEKKDAEVAKAEASKDEPMDATADKEEEPAGEREQDAPDDKRKRVEPGAVALNMADATLNVMLATNGKLVTALTDGGFQYLLASARSTVGMKDGRYMFEVTMVESLNPAEAMQHGRSPQPRQLVRVGVSTAGSSLFLADGPDNVCFDSEGSFTHNGNRQRAGDRFGRGQTVAVLLNLDSKSANANTISLFRDGVRISEPQKLPEELVGKPLYPTVTYRNVTLQVNFGPPQRAPLPFKCRMLAGAAADDVVKASIQASSGGKNEVVFPVGLPDKGYFDWVDLFLKQNPSYTELSDRKLVEWATASGLWGQKSKAGWSSNDKPDVRFGVPTLDDSSIRKMLSTIAPTLPRSYIVPELTSNLLTGDRKEAVLKFANSGFCKKAVVLMGEPDAAYKEYIHGLMLTEKKEKAQADQAEQAKRKEEEPEKAPDAEDKGAGEGDADEEMKEGEDKEAKEADEKKEAKEADEKKEEKKEEKAQDEPKEVELSEEEKATTCRKSDAPDINERELSKSYANFTLPSQAEGFDTVAYAWEGGDACAKLMKAWVLEKKLTQRAEDLQPGDWFKEEWSKWQKTVQEWRRLQGEFKDPAKRRAAQAKKKKQSEKKGDTEDGDEGEQEEKAEEEEEEKVEINAEDIDVFSVKDVCDLGNGEPLFAHFVYEDWTLLNTRYELHLLVHAFKKDLDDADRPSFSENHLGFYYHKYFRKTFHIKYFGVETFAEFVEFIKDTVAVDEKSNFLKVLLAEDSPIDNFVKFTEDHRRERQQRVDAGDETAKLKFSRPAPPPPPRGAEGGHHGGQQGGHQGGHSGGRGPPQHQQQQWSRRGQDSGGSRRDEGSRSSYGSGGGSHGGAGQKRPYQSAGGSSYSSSKQPRGGYSSGGGGSGYGGGSGGGGGGNYRSGSGGGGGYGRR